MLAYIQGVRFVYKFYSLDTLQKHGKSEITDPHIISKGEINHEFSKPVFP